MRPSMFQQKQAVTYDRCINDSSAPENRINTLQITVLESQWGEKRELKSSSQKIVCYHFRAGLFFCWQVP